MVDGGQLLATLRVLDLSDGPADGLTRLLADLGAEVLKVEPPGGSPGRAALPSLAGVSIPFALHNANKRSTVLDPASEDDRRRLIELAGTADVVVDSGNPGRAAAYGTSCEALADRFDQLVALHMTDFGLSGPRATWRADDQVLYAMSTALSRSGPTSGTPVLPPDGIASATAAVQAGWAVLVAYYNRLRCGRGDYIDFARFDAVVMALDPVFGSHGQAAAGMRGPQRWRGRPKNQDAYPIYACKDGYVRMCVLAPRQWRGLRAWLGEPEEFGDPKYDVIAARFAAWAEIAALIRPLFADQTMEQVVAAGQTYGVPISAVLSPSEALTSDHFRAVGAMVGTDLGRDAHASVPVGYFVVDGKHAGYRTPAPAPGRDEPRWRALPRATPTPWGAVGDRPFEGLRIVDLGIIVAGGELSRLFGDLGAEVIKVESSSYPDGLRQVRVGDTMSESFAWTHRNNLALGLELRTPAGADVFGRLVAGADAVFANFKPGTLASLGFSYESLRALNRQIVLAESSAFGATGPWSERMGYGPLVRACTGVTRVWTSPDAAADSGRHPFYDATTVFPDHIVGRITAIGALAALIHQNRTGEGCGVHVSQADAVVNQLDAMYVAQAARHLGDCGGAEVRDDTSVQAVYPCAGDDEWCVISIRSDNDWRATAEVIGRPDLADDPRWATGELRVANRHELVAELTAWTRDRSPWAITPQLQAAGVRAEPMNRAPDVLEDVQLAERNLFCDMDHPLFDHPLPAETGPAPFRNIPQAAQRPAPLAGQDTREICQKVLAMDTEETERLIADGVLFTSGGKAHKSPGTPQETPQEGKRP